MHNDPYAPPARRYTQLPRYFRWFSAHCVVRQLDDSDVARVLGTVTQTGFAQCRTGAAPQTNDQVVDALHAAQDDWRKGTRYAMAVLKKLSHDFVGWVELAPHAANARGAANRGAWFVDGFLHPDFFQTTLALEAFGATADLAFSALNAQTLCARCPAGNERIADVLNTHGFIEVAAAGKLDPVTGAARTDALYELGLSDWLATSGTRVAAETPASMPQINSRRRQDSEMPAPAITAQWVAAGMRAELTLL